MSLDGPRLTPQTARVLDALIDGGVLSGVEIGRSAKLASGTLYPILVRLEDAGWVSSTWEAADARELGRPRRRFYSVTSTGLARARSAAAEQMATLTRLAGA